MRVSGEYAELGILFCSMDTAVTRRVTEFAGVNVS